MGAPNGALFIPIIYHCDDVDKADDFYHFDKVK